MIIDENARYTKTHEWARKEENVFVVGITDHAQINMGDIVFVDLPKAGSAFKAGEVFGAIESVKSATDLFMPVSGTISAENAALTGAPETVNKDCYGEGWLVKVQPVNPDEFNSLLNPQDYDKICQRSDSCPSCQ